LCACSAGIGGFASVISEGIKLLTLVSAAAGSSVALWLIAPLRLRGHAAAAAAAAAASCRFLLLLLLLLLLLGHPARRHRAWRRGFFRKIILDRAPPRHAS